jgi:hypothetical protein
MELGEHDHEDKDIVDRQRELEEVSGIVFRCGGSAFATATHTPKARATAIQSATRATWALSRTFP